MTKDNEGLVSRWSRRKLDKTDDVPPEVEAEPLPEQDENSLPLWQQKDVDSDSKRESLTNLFRQPEFNDVDHMNEYDEDFTQFSGLGNIVTQEMKRMLRVVEERTRPEEILIASDESLSVDDDQAENKEDNEIA